MPGTVSNKTVGENPTPLPWQEPNTINNGQIIK
jgi:hypothetical protein